MQGKRPLEQPVSWSQTSKGLRLVSLVWQCFFPTEGAVAYDAANLQSLANAALLLVSLSDSNIAMVNFF